MKNNPIIKLQGRGRALPSSGGTGIDGTIQPGESEQFENGCVRGERTLAGIRPGEAGPL